MNAKAQIQKRGAVRAGQILSERLTFANGAFEQSNFHDYTPIRLTDAPQIDVELIDSGHPSGIGEPAATAVAPAVANAIYKRVGECGTCRLRPRPCSPPCLERAVNKTSTRPMLRKILTCTASILEPPCPTGRVRTDRTWQNSAT